MPLHLGQIFDGRSERGQAWYSCSDSLHSEDGLAILPVPLHVKQKLGCFVSRRRFSSISAIGSMRGILP